MTISLVGPNDYLRKEALSKLIADFTKKYGEMAIEHIDGEDADFETINESLNSLPFLTEKKMVIFNSPSHNKRFFEDVSLALEKGSGQIDVIIVEPKVDKRSSYYKSLKKDTDFREFTELDKAGLINWFAKYINDHSGQISSNDARLVIERVGYDQQNLKNEADKLLLYDSKVNLQSIELLTENTPQSSIFELLDAALSGDRQKTLSLYLEQRELQVEPQQIVAMLAWQLHILAVVKTAESRSSDLIADELRINPYVIRKSQSLAKSITLTQLKNMIKSALQLDSRLKNESIDSDEALQYFLLSLLE